MTRLVHAFADFLARQPGFVAVNLSWIAGVALLFLNYDFIEILTLYLAILAIVIGSAVLVAQRRGEIALQLKLDQLIEVSPGSKEAIGSEHKSTEELEQLKQQTEARALADLAEDMGPGAAREALADHKVKRRAKPATARR